MISWQRMRFWNLLRRYPWIVPMIIFSALVIAGASMHPLWGDEAETALFARNTLKYGVPTGWDGVNLMGINNAIVLDKHLLNHASPWGQYYLAAVSFFLFGQSAFTARLPFILLAIATMPMLYFLFLDITKEKRTALFACLILSFSVQYILFAYQARYYSLVMFAGVILTWALLHLSEKKFWPNVAAVMGAVWLFYGNYLIALTFGAALALVHLILWVFMIRKYHIGKLALLFGLIALLCIPWFLLVTPERSLFITHPLVSFLRGFFSMWLAALGLWVQANAIPIVLVPPFAVMLVISFMREKKQEKLQSFFVVLHAGLLPLSFLAILAALSVMYRTVSGDRITQFYFFHTRYNAVVMPFFALGVAWTVNRLWQWRRMVGLATLLLSIGTGILHFAPKQSYLISYIGELLHPYESPDALVASYLNNHARPGDTAFVNIDRDHEPLIFLLGDRIRFVDRVERNNSRIFPENRSILPRYIYDFRENPDWVILFSKRPVPESFLTIDLRPLPPGVDLGAYEETVLPVFFSDTSRPELYWHSFVKIEPEYRDQIFVYRKKR